MQKIQKKTKKREVEGNKTKHTQITYNFCLAKNKTL